MKASIFYRISAVLLVLFAIGHTIGFSQSDPQWGLDALLGSLKSTRFDALGSSRTFWDFFVALGYIVGVFYLFAAILAWQLGGLSTEALRSVRLTAWAFALCFVAVAAVSWLYLFDIPIAFSSAVALCLLVAAWLSTRRSASAAREPGSQLAGTRTKSY